MNNTIIINISYLIENWNHLKKINGSEQMVAVVKSDAYGFGMNSVSKILYDNGCRQFAVSNSHEGTQLRSILGGNINIITLNGYEVYNASIYKDYDLIPGITCKSQLEVIDNKQKCWVHFDTGLNRTGIPFEEHETIKPLIEKKNVSVIMSHLSFSSPGFIRQTQLERVEKLFESYEDYDKSLLKTAGFALDKKYYYNNPRIGHGLYFKYDYLGNNNIAVWQSRIIQIKTIQPEEYVGYNGLYKTHILTKVAMVNCGYSHGLHTNHPYVIIDGRECTTVGAVSMEMVTVDVSHIECSLDSIVYIFYDNWDEVAKKIGVSCGVLSTRVNKNSVKVKYDIITDAYIL